MKLSEFVQKIEEVMPLSTQEDWDNSGLLVSEGDKEITKVLKSIKYDYELLLINDGSKDKTLDILRKLSKEEDRVRYISFSRI